MTLNAFRRPAIAGEQIFGDSREAEALCEVLDRMWEAVALVSESGKVVYANLSASRIFDGNASGLALSADGRLIAATHDARSALTQALKPGSEPASIPVPRAGQSPLVLRVQPLSEAMQGVFDAVALLFISDPDSGPADCTATLRTLYGLTKTEAQCVQWLSEGASLKKIASTQRVTYETVRTHVRRILIKTGARRQAELVRITHALR